MDFFEHQEKARRKTGLLVVYFCLAVVGIVAALYASVWTILATTGAAAVSFLDPELLGTVSLGTIGVIGFGTAYKFMELSKGGVAVAADLRATPVHPQTTEIHERRLLNVVEEMAIASGIPAPQVFVMEDPGINAFAAGNTPADAVIGVTRGCMTRLSRDELQGVVAHEFSHILNGDMRLNLRLIGFIFGILLISILGRLAMNVAVRMRVGGGSRDDRGAAGFQVAFMLLGVALMVVGAVGVLFARLIQGAISRQREYLADASAVQFTRNPEGIAGALKKIGAMAGGSRVAAPFAAEANHLFFANGLAGVASLFASHPPLVDRIRVLDPSFDGDFERLVLSEPDVRRESPLPSANAPGAGSKPPLSIPGVEIPGLPTGMGFPVIAAGLSEGGSAPANSVPDRVGRPDQESARFAAQLNASLGEELHDRAREPFGAMAVIFWLLVSDDEGMSDQQFDYLRGRYGDAMLRELSLAEEPLQGIPRSAYLSVVDVCLPALRTLSAKQSTEFDATVHALVKSDEEVSLFEFALLHVLLRNLFLATGRTPTPKVTFVRLSQIAGSVRVLLSALAHAGGGDPELRNRTFAAGAAQLGEEAANWGPLPAVDSDLAAVDQALAVVSRAAPGLKRPVVLACAHAAGSDGVLRAPEAELLRAITESLDCPLPPFAKEIAVAN